MREIYNKVILVVTPTLLSHIGERGAARILNRDIHQSVLVITSKSSFPNCLIKAYAIQGQGGPRCSDNPEISCDSEATPRSQQCNVLRMKLFLEFVEN